MEIKDKYYLGQIITLENSGEHIITQLTPHLEMKERMIVEKDGVFYDVYRLRGNIVSAYVLDKDFEKIPLYNSHGSRILDIHGNKCFEHKIINIKNGANVLTRLKASQIKAQKNLSKITDVDKHVNECKGYEYRNSAIL